jgi:hypothetical protein
MRNVIIAAAAAVLASAAGPSVAANLVQNGGFEDVTLTPAQQAQIAGYVGFQVTLGGYNSAVDHWFSSQAAPYNAAYNLYFFDGDTAKTGDAFSQYPGEQQRPNANFTGDSPDGGAFMILDGDPGFNGPFQQTVNGLTIGKQYELSFYWAAGELSNRTGYETVRLGGTFGASAFTTPTFNNTKPLGVTGDFRPWDLATFEFTATSATQVLSFLAVGTPANNLPPVAFLDGVSLTEVPEPGTWALMLLGFGSLGVMARRRRAALA